VKIVATNLKTAKKFEKGLEKAGYHHEVDYYRSDKTIGVKSDSRVMILIGAAYPPANAFDVVTTNKEESKTLMYENMQADTYQCLSRVKDPEGRKDSLVFALGITEDEMRGICTWGDNRTIQDNTVTCDKKLPMPLIIRCRSIEEMLDHARGWIDKILAIDILIDLIKDAKGEYVDIPGTELTKRLEDAGYKPFKVKEDWYSSGLLESNDLERKWTYRFKKNGKPIAGIRIILSRVRELFDVLGLTSKLIERGINIPGN